MIKKLKNNRAYCRADTSLSWNWLANTNYKFITQNEETLPIAAGHIWRWLAVFSDKENSKYQYLQFNRKETERRCTHDIKQPSDMTARITRPNLPTLTSPSHKLIQTREYLLPVCSSSTNSTVLNWGWQWVQLSGWGWSRCRSIYACSSAATLLCAVGLFHSEYVRLHL